MVWPGGRKMIYGMAWRPHDMIYGKAWRPWHGEHHMVYGMAWRTSHGMWYGLARYVMVCGKA